MRTPITLIMGPLGSGKTTLIRHILDNAQARLAVIVNEFGEVAIDTQVVQGKNVRIAELAGGCVCCSLIGEFEAAVQEIVQTVAPEAIVVETTGVAEPEAVVFDVAETLRDTRIDGVITVMDADAMVRFPEMGHTARLQVEAADIVLLNKVDLVPGERLEPLRESLHRLNPRAAVIPTVRCQMDPGLLFGLNRSGEPPATPHIHRPEYESFSYHPAHLLDWDCFFARIADALDPAVYRAKGFVGFANGTYLFNYVAGRWDMEPFQTDERVLVFIGKDIKSKEARITEALKACEV
jgi:G3E family GTPase